MVKYREVDQYLAKLIKFLECLAGSKFERDAELSLDSFLYFYYACRISEVLNILVRLKEAGVIEDFEELKEEGILDEILDEPEDFESEEEEEEQ